MNQKIFQRYTKFLGAIVFALLFFPPSFAYAIGHRPVKRFTTADGLPSSIIYTVFEDSKGYLWVGTDGGVAVYDGYKFISFTQTDGLPGNAVMEIKEDHKGRIWFKTSRSGFAWYENGKIYPCKANQKLMKDMKLGYQFCLSFFIDRNDVLWLSYSACQFYIRIQPQNDWAIPEKIPLTMPKSNTGWVKLIDEKDGQWLLGFRRVYAPDSTLYMYVGGGREVQIPIDPLDYYIQSTIRYLFSSPQYLFFL